MNEPITQLEQALLSGPEGDTLRRLLDLCPFAHRLASRYPDWASATAGDLRQVWDRQRIEALFTAELSGVTGAGISEAAIASLKQRLRWCKNRVFFGLMLRDLAGYADLAEVMAGISTLADLCIRVAVDAAAASLWQSYGGPSGHGDIGEPQQLIVIGMGKLGGAELNVSSDIDIIFVYPSDGATQGGQHSISHQEYFDRQAKRVIDLLHDLTADGYVFRVDTRLRPFGNSGPLVCHFDTLERYYQTHGRDWERYAMIKARPVCGVYLDELSAILHPFVYRKYLDYSTFESLRDLKRQIMQEVNRKNLQENVKLGAGGIREIEFITQVFQLIRGGRLRSLQTASTLKALAAIEAAELLPAPTCQELRQAYIYLRNLEHRLQYDQDAQTHNLPKDAGARQRLLALLKIDSWEGFNHELQTVRTRVSNHFNDLLQSKQNDSNPDHIKAVWLQEDNDSTSLATLTELHYRQPEAVLSHLQQVKQGRLYRILPQTSKDKFDHLAGLIIQKACLTKHADRALLRGVALLERIGGRSSYLSLFIEHPEAMQRVLDLLAESPYIAKLLNQYPLLLDTLLDERQLHGPLLGQQLEGELHKRLHDIEDYDQELQMDLLREFKHSYTFRLAAQELNAYLPITKISDALSLLADTIIRFVLHLSWRQMKCSDPPRFLIVAYGKLGSKEFSYSSDLDMVFLYDGQEENAQQTYIRLGQRINHWLTTYTSAGVLYETDYRLRPDGSKGMLALPIDSFAEYQHQRAWIWEHQALTRARWIAGDPQLGRQFEAIRQQVLAKVRDLALLKQELLAMRQRIQSAKKLNPDELNVKHIPGGMIDIEFMVQYLILAHAHQFAELTNNTGNIALLKRCAELGLIPADLAEQSAHAYAALRQHAHNQSLRDLELTKSEIEQLQSHTVGPSQLWRYLFESSGQS